MNTAFTILLVFLGCCSNVVFLELLVSECPESGNIITFSQFFFIALQGFVFTAKFGQKKNVIPIKHYAKMVAMFFVVQVTNNVVFGFNISMPLHMIYRSGSLIANLVLGVLILKNRYTFAKYLSVILITVGITLCTLASAGDMATPPTREMSDAEQGDTAVEYIRWLTGLAILTFALFMSARMGIFQETIYKQFGKHPGEALFYNHLLPLPGFLFLSKDIYNLVLVFNASEPFVVPLLMLSVPKMWVYLAGNVITQFLCIRSVFVLTTECTSLTVTMVVTMRKFFSLLFSIIYFQNPFTYQHWIGTVLVFGGTALFTDVFKMFKASEKTKKIE